MKPHKDKKKPQAKSGKVKEQSFCRIADTKKYLSQRLELDNVLITAISSGHLFISGIDKSGVMVLGKMCRRDVEAGYLCWKLKGN